MNKLFLLGIVSAFSLMACKKPQPVQPTTLDTQSKQVIDKVQSDLDKANALAEERRKAAEDAAQ